ncbi:MAG: DUF1178 family protein [Parvibaculales bacterium]
MIKYRLQCDKGHEFDGWFANSGAYEAQLHAGRLSCVRCDSSNISKAIMAPAIAKTGSRKTTIGKADTTAGDGPDIHAMMQKLTQHVEANFEDVGDNFAEEARKIHYGETDERDIYGQTTADEARDLLEEGVPVAPLPGLTEKQKN